jgi:uncharacterized protein
LKTCIIVFVKAPYPGQVKTRLGKSIGSEAAAQLYRYFTEEVLATVDSLGVHSIIFFSPAQDELVLREWLGDRSYQAQQDGHLGERMADAFDQCFQLGFGRVLILGSDCPDLPREYLIEALDALSQNHAVIGPSADGGYYTLGFTPSTFCPAVFGPLPWSTDQVFPQTLDILNQFFCPIKVLPQWSDIDTLADLHQFYLRHQNQPASSRSLAYIRHADFIDRA